MWFACLGLIWLSIQLLFCWWVSPWTKIQLVHGNTGTIDFWCYDYTVKHVAVLMLLMNWVFLNRSGCWSVVWSTDFTKHSSSKTIVMWMSCIVMLYCSQAHSLHMVSSCCTVGSDVFVPRSLQNHWVREKSLYVMVPALLVEYISRQIGQIGH
jgi:hypothetical protein